jgi:inosose dehydratase
VVKADQACPSQGCPSDGRHEGQEGKMSFLAAGKSGAFTVPGDGSINFVPVFKALDTAG